MPLLHFPTSLLLPPFSPSLRPISSSSSSHRKPISPNLPARDRVIDFGKYKGKMLGTLPSKYLNWVSKNLRARDFEEWARLADEVLQDPVYRDRLEWESAERILSGEGRGQRGSRSDSPVSDLLDISDRFGWDNEDKAGWARVNFDLLGTSKGRRIPRRAKGEERLKSATSLRIGEMGSFGRDWESMNERKDEILGGDSRVSKRQGICSSGWKQSVGLRNGEMGSPGMGRRSRNEQKDGILGGDWRISKMGEVGSLEKELGISDGERIGVGEGRKVGFLRSGQRYCIGEEDGEVEMVVRGKREETRERRRLRRKEQMEMLRNEVGVGEGRGGSSGEISMKNRVSGNGQLVNPFPGRGALLDKIREKGD